MTHLSVAQALEAARQHHAAGNLQQAEAGYRQVLAHDPRQPDALYLLGLIAHQAGHQHAAADLIGQSLSVRPTAEGFSNLGFILRELGRMPEAIAACGRAIQLNPNSHEAHNNLGFALEGADRLDDAATAYTSAATLKPDWAVPLQNLGRVRRMQNRPADAVGALRRAMTISGPNAVALNDLGVALQASYQFDDAAAALREAIRLAPAIPEIHNNLANVLHDTGRIDAAIASFREAVRIRPEFAVGHGNLLYAMHFDPACDPVKLLDEHRNWAARHAEPLTAASQPHAVEDSKGRRLRIGYLSGDLHDHPVGRFLLPILQQHDRTRVEVVCYYDGRSTDRVNAQLRAASDAWHDTGAMLDAELAAFIRGHRVDVLFDLAVHSPFNRLLVFARRPAPIQVTYLGYPGTTGMSAMDYRITDPYLDPPGESDVLYAERSLRPAATYWCYTPMPETPDVGELPARRNGFVTFGCLNNFAKNNPRLHEIWATLLRHVPSSRMLLHAHPGTHRDDARRVFESHGVDPGRIEFVGSQTATGYLGTYNRIDVALDPMPYHGGTTTCDALWMGVPVVTVAGRIAAHRAGVSLLSNAGLPELIASTPDEYVNVAKTLAVDATRLEELRRTLRDRVRRSPICDVKTFTRGLEEALLNAWRERARA